MSRCIVFLYEPNGKLFGAHDSLLLFTRKIAARRQSANVRKMLLELLLGFALHDPPAPIIMAYPGNSE